MSRPRRWVPWLALFGAIAAIDLAARFVLPFSLNRVLAVEALLFFGAALATLALIARPPHPCGWRRVLQWLLVGAFALAGLRAAIWAAGQPVARANVVIVVLAVLALAGSWLRRRRRTMGPTQPRNPS
jgi:MYXO-CTERM domain-containing protein